MSIRTWISPLAIAAALTFSSGAMAQVMIGGSEIPAEDMFTFQEKCDALLAAKNQSLTVDEELAEDEIVTGSVEEQAQDSPDPAADEHRLALLASLTVEECQAAGLLP
jgi:hypothetical protein